MVQATLKLIKTNTQFFKYCVGGATAFVVDFSLLYIFTELIGIWYLWSATLSFIIAALVNYFIQRFWTFKSKEKKAVRQFLLFLSVQIVGLFINNTTLYVLVEYVGTLIPVLGGFALYLIGLKISWYLLAKGFASIIVLIWNFWASKMFVFNHKFINQKKSILIAGEIFPPDIGGPATYTHRLAKHLITAGYPVHILCYSTVMPAQADEEFGSHITRVSSFISLPYKYFLYFVKLFNLAFRAKVIYAQGPVASGWPALLVSKILRKRLVIKVVGDYCWEQAQLYGATRKTIDDWQKNPEFKAAKRSDNFKLRFINFIEKSSVRNADQIIVPSHYLKKLVTLWGVRPDRINVIYNSVEFSLEPQPTLKQAQEKIGLSGDILITGGRLVPWKGLSLFVKLMPQLKKINPAFKLVIFGSGIEAANLKRLITKYKLEHDIILVGRIPHQDLYLYYLSACMFVINSSYEGLSHIILDAMYYHLPIVASNAGGNPELIQDDYNGCLVEHDNFDEWLKAITRLWRDTKMRQRFSSNPIVKMDVFSFKHMIHRTIKVLIP